MENKTFEIEGILYLLKKQWKIILGVTLSLTILAGIYVTTMSHASYTASVKIFSGKTQEAQYYGKDELESNRVLMDTYIQLIQTDNFMNKIIEQTGVGLTPAALKSGVKFAQAGNAPILTITYTSLDPTTAQNVVEKIANEFEHEVKETILNINTKVIESVKVIENSPRKVKKIILAFMVGLILSIGIVLVKDYLDNTVKTKEELEKLLPIPVLVEIPKEKKLLK